MKIERSDVNDLILMNQKALAAVRDGIKDGDIPVWLLLLVLIRLPPKLIFRFKCVCKQWLSVISNPSFVRFYCSRASLLHPWTFISSYMYFNGLPLSNRMLLADIYSNDYERPYLHLLSLPSFQHPYGKDYLIIGVSNGLVLYGPLENHTAVVRVCNPVTGHFITLPPRIGGQGWDNWGFVANVEDGVLVSYTVMHLYAPFLRKSRMFYQTEVFVSEIGEWRIHDVHIDRAIDIDPTSMCVYLNGNFHWLAQRTRLITYDPGKYPDQVRIIALPGEGNVMNSFDYMAASNQGQLTYYQLNDVPDDLCSLSIWVLNDYRSGDWFLQHKVSLDIEFPDNRIGDHLIPGYPLSVDPYDPDIIYFGYYLMLVSYNIKTKKLDFDHVNFGRVLDNVSLNREWMTMLVYPPWPVSLSRPSWIAALKD
ncbi:hypothetical protein ACJIZ3_022034 [Penstemon smallii]|uniref:F-box domain-containing protein n=1 Tax=Penstemon smallii TaxID=265156 RepID=A0ABD3SNF6_9LAMI